MTAQQARPKQQQNNPKAAKTALTPTRAENFPEWYQAAVKASDLAENAPVRGCMTIKPYGYALWENIQKALDGMIKREGVQNAYFPLLIPLSFIAKEADHIDGFATECAVVTHHRLEKNDEGKLVPAPSSQLSEPLIVRPTSETIIGETIRNWIQSYRDLPLKLNQWCNVFRWEMRPRLFLRTAEFLWQEGHNVFETPEEAAEDTRKMMEVYADLLEDWLAVPVIRGEKTPDERFPGAINTLTVEAMMQDGKALQSGTSHNLGQTFSKSAEITFQDRNGAQKHAWTTSWGLSTRTIGGLIMVHGDDDGIKMPPKVAPYQIVILPFLKGENDDKINAYCQKLNDNLNAGGIRVLFDRRDMRTGDKAWDAIKKGIPLRVEAGGREMEAGEITVTRRDLGRDSKQTLSVDAFIARAQDMLDQIQADMFAAAKKNMDSRIFDVKTLAEANQFFADERQGFVRMDSALLDNEDFAGMKKEFAVTPRCLPLADEGKKVLIGKSY